MIEKQSCRFLDLSSSRLKRETSNIVVLPSGIVMNNIKIRIIASLILN